ncbi:hypothetical protein [Micromonospora sp. URMC 106]|uniref:hypothetical protein n=1 Tax=Micromonospora sp. URMC 106 TaxID=3423408 RepID=UPI003F52ADE9
MRAGDVAHRRSAVVGESRIGSDIHPQPGHILARLIDVSLSSVVESAFQARVIGADEAGIEPAPQHSKSKVRRG